MNSRSFIEDFISKILDTPESSTELQVPWHFIRLVNGLGIAISFKLIFNIQSKGIKHIIRNTNFLPYNETRSTISKQM